MIRAAASPRRLIGVTAACLAALALGAALAGPAGAATRVSYRAFANQAPKTFFDKGGLQLRGQCGSNNTLSVFVRSTVNDATVHINSQGSGSFYMENDDLDPGPQMNLTAGLEPDSVAGQLVYGRPGGTNVSVDWLAEEDDAYSGARGCAFVGTARFVDSGSSYRANYRFDGPDGPTTFFNHGGLELIGSCTAGVLEVRAETNADDSEIHANSQYAGNGVDYAEDDNFDIGDSFDLDDAANETMDDAVGQIGYAKPGGTNVTVDWAAEDDGNALGRDCVFNGVARVRSSGDPKRVNFRVPVGPAGPTTFFNQGGLKLSGDCSADDLDVTVSTASDYATVHYNGQHFSDANSGEEDFFSTDPDSPFEMFDELGLPQDADSTLGQIVYSSYGGTNVTVRYAGETAGGFGGTMECAIVGAAEVATK